MPLDLSGFRSEPNQWAGLYHTADMLEKRKLRQEQLAYMGQSRRAAAGTFLQNYLDPKDYLSGTTYDPMLLQGLQTAMQKGSQLAAAGADAPTLMMALGPMVNKITQYSTNAKNINKQVDDQIKLMRESGLTGYDYSKLKDEAMRQAFFKEGPNGQTMADPGEIDPSVNYIQKALEANPEKLTTAAGLDLFAKNSPMTKTLYDRQTYTGFGEQDRSKVHLIGQNWLVPERDRSGKIVDLVPEHDIATEAGQPLFHNFIDDKGQQQRSPVRLLSESRFDDMMQRRPDIADYLKGVVKQHLKEYTDQGGKPISMQDPRAKLVARAIAYDELKARKAATIERADIVDKPSPQQISLKIGGTDQYINNIKKQTEARTQTRLNVTNQLKSNPGKVFDEILSGNPEYLQGNHVPINGKDVIEITPAMPGGGLKAGRGQNFKYGKLYYDPSDQSFIVEKNSKDKYGIAKTELETIKHEDLDKFKFQIGEANGIKLQSGQAPTPAADPAAEDFNNRQKKWRNATKSSANSILSPFGKQQ